MFKKTIAMTGAAALLALGLTGCGATLGGGAQSESWRPQTTSSA